MLIADLAKTAKSANQRDEIHRKYVWQHCVKLLPNVI